MFLKKLANKLFVFVVRKFGKTIEATFADIVEKELAHNAKDAVEAVAKDKIGDWVSKQIGVDIDLSALSVLPNTGVIARAAAKDASSKEVLSVREANGRNDGLYVETYLKSVNLGKGNPWCMAFVYFRLNKAAQTLKKSLPKDFPVTGYTPTAANYFKQRGLWIPCDNVKAGERPQVGDLAFYYFASQGRIAHVGIVVEVYKDYFVTIEGNTGPSNTVGTVVRDGDGVYKKKRAYAELGKSGGFARVNF